MEHKPQIDELRGKIAALREFFDLEKMAHEIRDLEGEMSSPNFWHNQNEAKHKAQILKELQGEYDG
ncbi:MAG: peptide chain release factor 2, partial [bacterium]